MREGKDAFVTLPPRMLCKACQLLDYPHYCRLRARMRQGAAGACMLIEHHCALLLARLTLCPESGPVAPCFFVRLDAPVMPAYADWLGADHGMPSPLPSKHVLGLKSWHSYLIFLFKVLNLCSGWWFATALRADHQRGVVPTGPKRSRRPDARRSRSKCAPRQRGCQAALGRTDRFRLVIALPGLSAPLPAPRVAS